MRPPDRRSWEKALISLISRSTVFGSTVARPPRDAWYAARSPGGVFPARGPRALHPPCTGAVRAHFRPDSIRTRARESRKPPGGPLADYGRKARLRLAFRFRHSTIPQANSIATAFVRHGAAMQILDELSKVARRLDADGIEYALCGGLAMAVYAMPRATLDIDQDDIRYLRSLADASED